MNVSVPQVWCHVAAPLSGIPSDHSTGGLDVLVTMDIVEAWAPGIQSLGDTVSKLFVEKRERDRCVLLAFLCAANHLPLSSRVRVCVVKGYMCAQLGCHGRENAVAEGQLKIRVLEGALQIGKAPFSPACHFLYLLSRNLAGRGGRGREGRRRGRKGRRVGGGAGRGRRSGREGRRIDVSYYSICSPPLFSFHLSQ